MFGSSTKGTKMGNLEIYVGVPVQLLKSFLILLTRFRTLTMVPQQLYTMTNRNLFIDNRLFLRLQSIFLFVFEDILRRIKEDEILNFTYNEYVYTRAAVFIVSAKGRRIICSISVSIILFYGGPPSVGGNQEEGKGI